MSDDPDQLRTVVRPDAPEAGPRARFVPGQILADRYRIIAPLGSGGMGEVYRAEDRRLGQDVALKFLPVELAGDARMLQRLAAEVRIGRGVSHPNVCRLYDLVDTGGVSFITMEFVDGEDLASLLRRIGRLPFEKAVALTRDICSGLAAAHDLGVIHRDLKPANIMIDGRGHARITDFGLALARGEGRPREIAGTPAYMAPEQSRGDLPTVRSDLYSLGAVLFEMFTGRRPAEGKALPSSLVREMTPELERIMLACIEESPERRPSSARSIVDVLPSAQDATPSAGAMTRDRPGSAGRAAASLAVLPFEDLTAGGDDSFSVGLADEIISDLSKIRALRVISRGSAMRYRGAHDLTRVAEELRVAFLLTGSVRKAGDQIRLTANLVDGTTDEIVWSEKFKGSIADIFDIQEAVARTVADHLRVKVSSEERELIAERPIRDPLAHEYFIRARNESWKFTPEGMAAAELLLKRAVEVAGENALLYGAMAYVEWQYFNTGIDTVESRLIRAEELARKVFALEPDSPGGHRIMGLVAISRGDPAGGARELRRVVEADPNDVDALAWLSLVYSMAGHPERAEPLGRHLERIDPFGLLSLMGRAIVFWTTVDAERGLALTKVALELYPDSIFAYGQAALLAISGQIDRAAREFEAAGRYPGSFMSDLAAFMAAAVRGEKATALQILRDKVALAAWADLQYSVEVACGLSALGEIDQALEWLANGVRRGFTARDYLGPRNRLLSNVRADSRFAGIETLIEEVSARFEQAIDSANPA